MLTRLKRCSMRARPSPRSWPALEHRRRRWCCGNRATSCYTVSTTWTTATK